VFENKRRWLEIPLADLRLKGAGGLRIRLPVGIRDREVLLGLVCSQDELSVETKVRPVLRSLYRRDDGKLRVTLTADRLGSLCRALLRVERMLTGAAGYLPLRVEPRKNVSALWADYLNFGLPPWVGVASEDIGGEQIDRFATGGTSGLHDPE